MLASLNTNQSVYLEPNDLTWEIIRKNKQKYYSPKELEEYIAGAKEHMVTVNVRGETKKLIKMQLWVFMSDFGDQYYMGMPGPCTVGNEVYFETDELCPIHEKEPELPAPIVYSVSKGQDVVIETGFADGDTVRVSFGSIDDNERSLEDQLKILNEGPNNIFAYWGAPGDPVRLWTEQIIDGKRDYIVTEKHNKIILHNSYPEVLKCKISFAPYKKKD